MSYVDALEILAENGGGHGRRPSPRLSGKVGTNFFLLDSEGVLIARIDVTSKKLTRRN